MNHALVQLPDLRLGPGQHASAQSEWIDGLVERAAAAGEDISASLQLAREYGSHLPLPGHGETAARWAALAALGGANLTVARVFEAHTDAIAILAEAESAEGTSGVRDDVTYGVFAAEGPSEPLRATRADDRHAEFRLTGIKSWCSLGSQLDVGLVTAHVTRGRQLFQVDLHDPSVTAEPTSGWVARGLRAVTSTSLRFDSTPATAVGGVDWYLTRPGFSWGGIGVAACWYGGALGLQRRLEQSAKSPLDPLIALHIGAVDVALYAAGQVLASAATAIDEHTISGAASGSAGELLALRTRTAVVEAAERTIRELRHALGPSPLAFEEEHARRVADLELYLGQHHAERDLAALGRAVVDHADLSSGS